MACQAVPGMGPRERARGRREQPLRSLQPDADPGRVPLHHAPGTSARRTGARRRQLLLPSPITPDHRRLRERLRETACAGKDRGTCYKFDIPSYPPPFEGPSNVISILFTMARDQGIHSNALESNNFFVRSLRNTSGHSCLGTKTMNNTKNSHQCTNGITCIYSALSFCLFRVINMLTASFLDV